MLRAATAVCGAVAIACAATMASAAAGAAAEPAASARLKSQDGKDLGTVEFRSTPSGFMLITATATDLPPGKHAFHIHETGRCDPADGFKSAGGHLANGKKHGVLTEGGPHPGDLPNVVVSQDGQLNVEIFVNRLSVEGGWFENAGLFDDDGSAVVLHSGPDDYTSQPSGDAGDRIACGVIRR